VPLLSDGLWGIKSIDYYEINSVVDELGRYGTEGYCLDSSKKCVREPIDEILAKAYKTSGKKYDQIIAVVPLRDIAGGWLGLGGTGYNSDSFFCQLTYKSGTESYHNIKGTNYAESAFVHEILHSINVLSKEIDPDKTVFLHENVGIYKDDYYEHGQNGWNGWGTWHSDYMRLMTADGKGIVPDAFKVYDNYKYKPIYGKARSYKKTDVSTLTVSGISDKEYTGKAIKPSVTVKNGSKTLKKGTDYTVSYVGNVNIGKAAVIITGRGAYTGSVAKTFDIVPAKTTLSVSGADGKYSLSWKKIKGAEYCAISASTDGGKTYNVVAAVAGDETTAELKLPKGKSYIFKMRAYNYIYPIMFYGAYSKTVKAEK